MPLFGRKKEEPQPSPQMNPVEKSQDEEKPSEFVEMLKMNLQKPQTSQQKQEIPIPQTPLKQEISMPPMTVKIPEPIEEEEHEIKKETQFAPLFIKLDRYKNILHQVSELKMTMLTVKNTLAVITEMDKLKAESMKMIQDAVERVDKKLAALDTELIKPSGYHDMVPQQIARESLQSELDELKGQIEALRFEMEQTA
jgi:two-component sensor histidine kinase